MDRRDPLFEGSDVVAHDMAEVDWAATPLGPSRSWAPELRAVVRVLLTSRFPMWMAWGPELTMLYNDAYRRDTLRDKHPWALGRASSEVWAEVWDAVTPQVRAVLDEGRSTWDEDLLLHLRRRGWDEESFHTFSYSPLADGDGVVRGLLCVVAETTERVIGQRRMTFLRDLTAATTGARSTTATLRAAGTVLGEGSRDLPVGVLYHVGPADPHRAHLAAAVGVTAGGAAAPTTVELGTRGGVEAWPPLARARAGALELVPPPGVANALPDGCDRVALVALAVPGADGETEGLLGGLVLGLSRHLAFDRTYREFVELVGGQVTSALLEARAIEVERDRAEGLAELDRTRRRFFADASHELRTPLTLIRGPLAGLLAEPDGDPGERRADLEVVDRHARRLTRLVGDLLEISRLHDGAPGPRRATVDLGRLTADVAATVASAMTRAGLAYDVDVPDHGPLAATDPRGWERIVGNLVANALKYTREGAIAVRLALEGDEAVLTVTDTGVGIPAAELPHLFERFRRVEGSWARSAEGSGIGLALVGEIARDLGGRVAVRSEPGRGSTFTVTVPADGDPADVVDPDAEPPADLLAGPGDSGAGERARALAEETAAWVASPARSDGGPGGEGRAVAAADPVGTVLVVDDNADMRAYMSRLLAPRATVVTAGDGDEALAAAFADPPDIVVSDVMMPGLDGLGLLAALRADPRTARVPVLLVSARAGEEAAVAGLAAQADDYLVKPFAPGELQARVLAHLQLGRARREAEARFVAVADLAPAMIWVADATGSRVFLNAAWTRFTGRLADDDLGDGWLVGVHPDDRAGYDAVRERAGSLERGWETDVRLRHADGTWRRVVEQAVALPAHGDGAGGWVGSCVDVQSRLRQADRARLLAEVGVAMGASDGLEGRLAELRRVLADARLADRVTLREPGPTTALDARGDLGLRRRPLVVRGRVLRVLELEREPTSAPWSADDDALLDEVVVRTLPALDNALLRAEERIAVERLALVQRATASLSAAATPIDVARAVLTHVAELMGPTAECAVFELHAPTRELRALARHPRTPDARSHGDVVGLDLDTLLTRAVRTERAVWVHEPDERGDDDGQDPSLLALMRARGLRNVVAIPLNAAQRVVGVVAVASGVTGALDLGERTTLMALAEPCGVALDRARIYRAEHEIAETLQRSLLPQRLPDIARLPIAVRYVPGAVGTSAGGDWYDVVEIDQHRVAVVVGDVVGQGTAAAAVMGQLRSALSGYLLAGHGPADALDLLDRLVTRVPGARASTAICLIVDLDSGEVCWSRAGHLPALLCGAGEHRLLTEPAGHGPMLGLGSLRLRDRTESEMTIRPGSSVVLYTDGLVERRDESLDEGLARLLDVAGGVADGHPETLATDLVARLAPAEAIDDVAVVVLRLGPPPLEVRLPAEAARLAALRRSLRAWSARAGLPGDVLEDLQLALGEAATNAVEHAYGPHPPEGAVVDVRLALTAAGDVAVEVHDGGVWRETPDDAGYRGRGMTLVRALARDVVVDTGPAGTTVRFTVPVVRP